MMKADISKGMWLTDMEAVPADGWGLLGATALKPNKYILDVGQIHFQFIQMTNSFLNLEKYI